MIIKAFLSHRYKSPEVNLYFHRIFSEIAQIQFEVDVGSLPTNVTRLERMIRNSDAFIGIFPYPGNPLERASSQDLLAKSNYFRLEVELAIRSRKPALVFLDQRYAPYFFFPPQIQTAFFDVQEITHQGESPSSGTFRLLFQDFCKEVKASKSLEVAMRGRNKISTKQVGIVVPRDGNENQKYNGHDLRAIIRTLEKNGVPRIKIKEFPWPVVLHEEYLSNADTCDWFVIDVGDYTMNSGIVGYLHGRFVPMLRIMKSTENQSVFTSTGNCKSLFGGIEVGYIKDIVVWKSRQELVELLNQRLAVLTAPGERIVSRNDAMQYFNRASLRKETVFVSYSGEDRDLASKISMELKKRFKHVFDYRDGQSITPGEPWLQEIFNKLSGSKLGIPLVSTSYFKSGNCTHEAQEMIAKRDMGEMAVIPLKLYEIDDFSRPSWLQNRQYMHVYDYPDISTTVDKLIEFFDRGSNNG